MADDRMRSRLRERSKRYGGGRLTVPNGRFLHLFSNVRLGGLKTPTEDDWNSLSPSEALRVLAEQALGLPGVQGARWLGDWHEAAERKGARVYISLGTVGDEIWTRAVDIAQERLSDLHGITGAWPRAGHLPGVIDPEAYAEALEDAVGEVRRSLSASE